MEAAMCTKKARWQDVQTWSPRSSLHDFHGEFSSLNSVRFFEATFLRIKTIPGINSTFNNLQRHYLAYSAFYLEE